MAVVALNNMLAAYYEGKQTMDAENVLLEQNKVIDFPLKPSGLSQYGEVLNHEKLKALGIDFFSGRTEWIPQKN